MPQADHSFHADGSRDNHVGCFGELGIFKTRTMKQRIGEKVPVSESAVMSVTQEETRETTAQPKRRLRILHALSKQNTKQIPMEMPRISTELSDDMGCVEDNEFNPPYEIAKSNKIIDAEITKKSLIKSEEMESKTMIRSDGTTFSQQPVPSSHQPSSKATELIPFISDSADGTANSDKTSVTVRYVRDIKIKKLTDEKSPASPFFSLIPPRTDVEHAMPAAPCDDELCELQYDKVIHFQRPAPRSKNVNSSLILDEQTISRSLDATKECDGGHDQRSQTVVEDGNPGNSSTTGTNADFGDNQSIVGENECILDGNIDNQIVTAKSTSREGKEPCSNAVVLVNKFVLVKIDRSNECFVQPSFTISDKASAKAHCNMEATKARIDHPQYAHVAATITLGCTDQRKPAGKTASEGRKVDNLLREDLGHSQPLSSTDNVSREVDAADTILGAIEGPSWERKRTSYSNLNVSCDESIASDLSKQKQNSSCSEVHTQTQRMGDNNDATGKFSSRLSRGFLDFTQESSERLQRWKKMLRNGHKHKDCSEPPPVCRMMIPINEYRRHLTDSETMIDSTNQTISSMQASHRKFGKTLPRIIYPTRSESTIQFNESDVSDSCMEHRTRRQKGECNRGSVRSLTMHFQTMQSNNAQPEAVNAKSNTNSSPTARTTKFSSAIPQDVNIIRPTAFRPYLSRNTGRTHIIRSASSHQTEHVLNRTGANISRHTQCIRSNEKGSEHNVEKALRPKPIYQPSTSCDRISQYVRDSRSRTYGNDENDYDIVAEYMNGTLATTSLNVCSVQQTSTKKSPSSQRIYGSSGSNGSYQSSGIHVTPSPSDSGIVDYEGIIRDKENELSHVRSTMEQNEEIVIRVYQEKEKFWREQIEELTQKLQVSQQGESALRQQIQRCNEQRDEFQERIQNLLGDKQGLQKKCLQIERELFQLREKLEDVLCNRENECEQCHSSSSKQHLYKPRIPAPRLNKEASSDREIRAEVDHLRRELSSLKELLNDQVALFALERKHWDNERANILTHHVVEAPTAHSNQLSGAKSLSITNFDYNPCIVSSDRII